MFTQKKNISLVLWGLIVLSFIARGWFILHDDIESTHYSNDALEHALVTWQCLNETPIGESYLLPLYTYADATNKGINNLPDAAVSDAQGNYYYVSFPPVSFALPSLLLTRPFGIAPSAHALRLFSLAIHTLITILSYLVIKHVTEKSNETNDQSHLLGTLFALSLVCAPEFIVSFTFNYWAQHVYLLVFLLQYLAYSKNKMGLFYALCFVGCLTEWTAYIANVGWALGLLFAAHESGGRKQWQRGLVVLLITACGLATLIGWYSLVTSPAEYLTLLTHRQGFRSTKTASLLYLPYYYGSSLRHYLLFIPLACIAAFHIFRKSQVNGFAQQPSLRILLFVTAFSLIENIVVLGHAANYSYDRLKGVYLICLLATLALPLLRQKVFYTGFVLLCLVSGVDQYWKVFANYLEAKHEYLNADFSAALATIRADHPYPVIANVKDVPCRVIAKSHANIVCYPANQDQSPQHGDFEKLATSFATFQKSIVCWYVDQSHSWHFYLLDHKQKTAEPIHTLSLQRTENAS